MADIKKWAASKTGESKPGETLARVNSKIDAYLSSHQMGTRSGSPVPMGQGTWEVYVTPPEGGKAKKISIKQSDL